MNTCSLQPSESMIFALRSLYDRYGYARYKMNKFEEYDLYARNKDFLISDGVITFTDTNGKLMALKPDVTLSIVKNTKDAPGTVQKLYYNENVYRVSKGTRAFKEIMQVGLEAIGEIDDYCIYEVLRLAAGSLECTGKNCILEISHLGLLADVLANVGIPAEAKTKVMHCIGEKNQHELASLCRSLGIPDDKTALISEAACVYGTPDEVLPDITAMLSGIADEKALAQFVKIVSALNKGKYKEMIRIDFSAVNDMRYYNGFVFKGFAEGIPSSILSGGQYDAMMRKMGRKSGAIGFAVYLDLLEQYVRNTEEFDVDNLIIYDESSDISVVEQQADMAAERGEGVLFQRAVPAALKYKRMIRIMNGEVKIVEENA